MACRKAELRLERRSISDALLLTTMCIIGMPVDVHAVDGSVYSGIFHTACVDKEYAIVLKTAAMIKKGVLDANVVDGAVIGTLVVRSEDILQVVVKGVVLPSYAELLKSNEPKEKNDLLYQSRQVADGSQEIQSDFNENLEFLGQRTVEGAQGSNPSITGFEAQSTDALDIPEGLVQQEPNGLSSGCSGAPVDKDQTVYAVASAPEISDTTTPILEVDSDSHPTASSDPFMLVPPKILSVQKTAKLNGGAQRFYPSMLYHRMASPRVGLNGASVPYRPGTCTLASMGNVALGHGDKNSTYFQPIIGQAVTRVQPPVIYTGQYQNFQTGPTYVHPDPQKVMFVRGGGPLLHMNPIPRPAAGLSPAAPGPPLAPHQLYLRDQQGNWSSQELQHYTTPPLVANGPQPYVTPSPIPISQPVLPFIRPTTIPGKHGYLSTKLV